MPEKREDLIRNAWKILSDAYFPRQKVLLGGDGNFYNRNGQPFAQLEALQYMHMMQDAICRAQNIAETVVEMDKKEKT